MNYLIHQLLNSEEINLIKKELEKCSQQDWEDGKKTAGIHASMVKNNLQLNRNSEASKKNSQLVNEKILSNQLIKSFSLPKRIHGIMFTKSSKNMHYGRHIDNPYNKIDLRKLFLINSIYKLKISDQRKANSNIQYRLYFF